MGVLSLRGKLMIELTPSEDDDFEFLAMVRRILNGAIAALEMCEVYVVQTNNWFDFKWLGWWSWEKQAGPKELCVPPFNPNRVQSEKRFIRDPNHSCFARCAHDKPLHVRQPGRSRPFAQRLDQFSKSAAFIWYSGNSVPNRAGSMMLYLSGSEGYSWYASFTRDQQWKINDDYKITRKGLVAFESAGREMELVSI
jgi:hypothetical protein